MCECACVRSCVCVGEREGGGTDITGYLLSETQNKYIYVYPRIETYIER